MKKTLSILILICMLFSLAACGKKEVQYAKEPESSIPEKGHWTDNVFKSDYADLTFEMPEGWISAKDDELLKLQTEGIYYDFMCQKEETGSQVALMFEELLLTEGSIAITEDEYIEMLSDSFSYSGMQVVETKDITLGKENYKAITVYGEADDFSVTQCSMVRKKGNTMISVIVTALNDDNIEDTLKFFK